MTPDKYIRLDIQTASAGDECVVFDGVEGNPIAVFPASCITAVDNVIDELNQLNRIQVARREQIQVGGSGNKQKIT